MDAQRIPFTEDDENKIASAATWGSIVAICTIAVGVITLFVMFALRQQKALAADLDVNVVVVAFSILINAMLLQASAAFRKVARTDVADQAYLLHGFRRLRIYFMVQVVGILLGIGTVLVMMVI